MTVPYYLPSKYIIASSLTQLLCYDYREVPFLQISQHVILNLLASSYKRGTEKKDLSLLDLLIT